MAPGCDAWMWKSLSFRCRGGGFGLHFGRLLVTLRSLCQVFLGYRKEVGILTDTLGTRPGFWKIVDGFWEPLGTNFGIILMIFS